MKDVSVEYAHIYTNADIGKEHETSLSELKEVEDELKRYKKSYNLVVLVDDYSFPDPTFDYSFYSDWLHKKGYGPDFIYRESQLIPLCDMVLELVNDQKLKNKIVKYIKSKKYPCSLFVAAWYLLRLGAIKHRAFNNDLVAKSLINILPSSFKPYEDEALKIISSTRYDYLAEKISYRFIKGRTI